jgi:hypothetical protein
MSCEARSFYHPVSNARNFNHLLASGSRKAADSLHSHPTSFLRLDISRTLMDFSATRRRKLPRCHATACALPDGSRPLKSECGCRNKKQRGASPVYSPAAAPAHVSAALSSLPSTAVDPYLLPPAPAAREDDFPPGPRLTESSVVWMRTCGFFSYFFRLRSARSAVSYEDASKPALT